MDGKCADKSAVSQLQASQFPTCLQLVLADIEDLYSLTDSTRQRMYNIFVNLGLRPGVSERLVRLTVKPLDLTALGDLINDLYQPGNLAQHPELLPELNAGERRQLAAALDDAFVCHGLRWDRSTSHVKLSRCATAQPIYLSAWHSQTILRYFLGSRIVLLVFTSDLAVSPRAIPSCAVHSVHSPAINKSLFSPAQRSRA
jgi:hypothetical protein